MAGADLLVGRAPARDGAPDASNGHAIASGRSGLSEFGWKPARTLHPHQLDGVAHALTSINAANFSVPGSGKTVEAGRYGFCRQRPFDDIRQLRQMFRNDRPRFDHLADDIIETEAQIQADKKPDPL